MDEHPDSFRYTYSAKQQEEVQKIRKKYLPQEESKMERLRRLDQSVTRPGTVASLVLGIVGCMLLGLGMSCTMVWEEKWFFPGIAIGLVGIAGICLAYPLYCRVTKRQREKLGPEILRLTDELMQ